MVSVRRERLRSASSVVSHAREGEWLTCGWWRGWREDVRSGEGGERI
jgi:hypothetical protein